MSDLGALTRRLEKLYPDADPGTHNSHSRDTAASNCRYCARLLYDELAESFPQLNHANKLNLIEAIANLASAVIHYEEQ